MIAVRTDPAFKETKKICCPECRSRLCDILISETDRRSSRYKIITDSGSESLLAIKCRKCGQIIGVGFTT